MNDLYTINYKDEGPFFLSNFGQITRATRIHGVHNEDAIDRNTEAIIAQTEMQHSESDESQIQFSGHSMMLERESNETQDIMTAHTQMMKNEMDETQNIMTAHTDTMKNAINNQGASIKNAISAQTNAMKEEEALNRQNLQAEIQKITSQLQAIAGKIDPNAANTISSAIRDLDLVVNNYISNP